MKKLLQIFKSRRFKYGSYATAFTAIFIAVIVFLNVIAGILTERFVLKVDMTSTGVFKLNKESAKVIDELKEKVNVYVLAKESQYPAYLKETLNRFKQRNSNYQVEYVDTDSNPSFLWEFQKLFSPSSGDIIIKSSKRSLLLSFQNMVVPSENNDKNYYRLEEMLVSGTINITKDTIPLVGFITGHGEIGSKNSAWSGLKSVFDNNGFQSSEIQLKDKPDSKMEYMVIADPTRDFTESDVKALDDFLNNGYVYNRHLFVYLDPQAPELPNLENYLKEWGIKVNHDIVIESENNSYQSQINLIPTYKQEMLGTFMSQNIPTVVPRAHSLDILFKQNDIIQVQSLLTTSSESFSKTLTGSSDISTTKEAGDKTGPFNIALCAIRQKYDDQNRQQANYVYVTGSWDIVNANVLSASSLGNNEFTLAQIKATRIGKDETYLNSTKYSDVVTLNMNDSVEKTMSIILIVVLPGIIAVIGVIVFIRRRYL